jgi:hypothetical protein
MQPTSSAGADEGWLRSSTCRAVDSAGKAAGRAYGLAEAMSRELVRLLSRQAKQQFAGPDPAARTTLDGLAQAFACDQLLQLADRLVTATSWAEFLADVVVPPPASGLPEYTKNCEIDFEPSGPSIDTYFQGRMKDGSPALIHLRLQKWYQPDLDRHLFEQSQKLQRKHRIAPTVIVFLLWPPAEGPGTTGRFEKRNTKGNGKQVFTYHLKRTWEIAPEEVMNSPGTMLLAPLTRGSRERMPEIMQMVKQGLDRCGADAKMRDMVWGAVYWSMGLICDQEEADRALGDLLPLVHQSENYLSAKGHAFLGAYSAAVSEGPAAAARALLLRQATCRFGAGPGVEEALAAITGLMDLERLCQRVLTAHDWPSLLEGMS